LDLMRKYQAKLTTANQAVKAVKDGDWVDYSFALGQPVLLDSALAARMGELRNINVRGGLMLRPLEIINADPHRDVFTYNSWHLSGYERKLSDKGLCNYIPMIYRNLPLYYRKSLDVDVAMFSVAPMDKHGYFSFSLTNSASKSVAEKAKTVIIEINENLPNALGEKDNLIHIDEVDYIVEGNNPDLPTIAPAEPSDIDKKIASYILKQITDGANIQLGVGALPNAVGTIIAESDFKNLGVHTEMLVDAFMKMSKAGKITNRYKNVNKGKSVWTFCAGSKELYDWVDGNQELASFPVNYTNDPSVMCLNDNLVTINNCIEVDIYGQVTSETSGSRQISGTGGQLDFLTGGYLSNGGKSFICFSSTFTDQITGQLKSRVLASLPENAAVTNPRTQAHYFATEWGIADLAGRSTWERAERIIKIAHPDFQEQLIRSADKMNIWRRTNKRV
jgi:butyryl-CoA:acetate CoA-transferase